ncbi:Hypothetical protein POVR1_LOCUS92 [uncultured virus]|nr:Hypothetical protein POVR1_LOCUS92 [uncultured virus]
MDTDEIDLSTLSNNALSFDLSSLNEEGVDALKYLLSQGFVKIRPTNIISGLESLPYDTFKDVILTDPTLAASDIISLCSSSRKLQSYCEYNNQEIYRDLLLRDYLLRLQDLDEYFQALDVEPSAKIAYKELSRFGGISKHLVEYVAMSYQYQKFGQQWIVYAANQWLLHRDEIHQLVRKHYSPGSWFDYSKFEAMMMDRIASNFFWDLSGVSADINNGEDGYIHFAHDLAFALVSNDLDMSTSDGQNLADQLEDAFVQITKGFNPKQ